MGTNEGTRLRLEASSIAMTSRPLRDTVNAECDERGVFARSALPASRRAATSRDASKVLPARFRVGLSIRLMASASDVGRTADAPTRPGLHGPADT